jgi:hypothetical protein
LTRGTLAADDQAQADLLRRSRQHHIPAAIFAGYRKLMGVHDAVRDHAGVKSWYAKS